MTARAAMIRNHRSLLPHARLSDRTVNRGRAAAGLPGLFVALITAGFLAVAMLGLVSTVALAG
jgi:hypothetical protein